MGWRVNPYYPLKDIMKVLINTCFGGYNLSHKAMLRYTEIKGITLYIEKGSFGLVTYWLVPKEQRVNQDNFSKMTLKKRIASNKLYEEQTLCHRDFRTDPTMVQVVEELGDAANGKHAKLKIVEIPDGIEYEIEEYDGMEHIAEVHRTWS